MTVETYVKQTLGQKVLSYNIKGRRIVVAEKCERLSPKEVLECNFDLRCFTYQPQNLEEFKNVYKHGCTAEEKAGWITLYIQ